MPSVEATNSWCVWVQRAQDMSTPGFFIPPTVPVIPHKSPRCQMPLQCLGAPQPYPAVLRAGWRGCGGMWCWNSNRQDMSSNYYTISQCWLWLSNCRVQIILWKTLSFWNTFFPPQRLSPLAMFSVVCQIANLTYPVYPNGEATRASSRNLGVHHNTSSWVKLTIMFWQWGPNIYILLVYKVTKNWLSESPVNELMLKCKT